MGTMNKPATGALVSSVPFPADTVHYQRHIQNFKHPEKNSRNSC